MPAQPLRVLIVEDNADDAALLVRVLRQGHYDLTWERVDSSAGLQAALRRQTWDIVISDYSMPQFNGLSALQVVKAHDDNLPFLLVSGTVGEDIAVNAMQAGANDYIMKDNPARLIPAIEHRKQREAQKAIKEASVRWQNTFDAVNDAILILDANQQILQCNRTAEVLLSKPSTNMIGRPCWEVVHGLTSPPPYCPVTRLRRSLCHEATELVAGSRLWNVEVDPILESDGTLTGVVHSIRDITDYKRLQSQLFLAQKMESIGQLAGGVAHDFNNLLQAIIGHTELLLDRTPAGDERHADLVEIQKTGKRAAELTRQLLAFARKQNIEPRVIDLDEAVNGALKMLRRLIGEHIELVWAPGPQLWPVWIDPAQIDQILANLLVNARDAIHEQGRITLAAENRSLNPAACAQLSEAVIPGDYVKLTVRDTGCGMSKETLARLFEPFFTTKGVGQGTGLGLSTIYGIIRQNHGCITVESAPGQGSAFHLFLPRHNGSHNVEPAKDPGTKLPTPRGETVLLVEDELSILTLGKRVLQQLGYNVLAAEAPGKALALASGYPGNIHLLLTDVVMPEMSGRELSEHLLIQRPGIKTLFMSGYTSDIMGRHGVLGEGMNFIPKPFTKEALAGKVRQVLDGP
jgi:PAS domain S-box-containing protein